jgi:hypothetical protein
MMGKLVNKNKTVRDGDLEISLSQNLKEEAPQSDPQKRQS